MKSPTAWSVHPRVHGDQPANLALVDLSYQYDPAGNISSIDDGVRQEERSYQYDFLDRLTYAGVYICSYPRSASRGWPAPTALLSRSHALRG